VQHQQRLLRWNVLLTAHHSTSVQWNRYALFVFNLLRIMVSSITCSSKGLAAQQHLAYRVRVMSLGCGRTQYTKCSWFQAFAMSVPPSTTQLSNFTHFISTHLRRWNRRSVPKHRLLNTTCRGTTQKITRNIPNVVCVAPPEDEQVMLETYRDP
jgi:hypothetical protein